MTQLRAVFRFVYAVLVRIAKRWAIPGAGPNVSVRGL